MHDQEQRQLDAKNVDDGICPECFSQLDLSNPAHVEQHADICLPQGRRSGAAGTDHARRHSLLVNKSKRLRAGKKETK